VTAVKEIDNETGVGKCGKSNDTLLLCELVKYPLEPSQLVVASVYGAAAVVPSAKAVATPRPAVWPPAIPAPAKVLVEAVVAVRSPNASDFAPVSSRVTPRRLDPWTLKQPPFPWHSQTRNDSRM
jgi:hypothetical protein